MTVNRSILVVASVGDTFDDWATWRRRSRLTSGRARELSPDRPGNVVGRGREAASGHLSDVLAGLQSPGWQPTAGSATPTR